jgi:hypothetical protein
MAPSPAPDTFYKSLFLFRMQSRVCFNHSAGCISRHTNSAAKIRPNAGTERPAQAFLDMMKPIGFEIELTRLLALAILVREQGQIEHSDQLTQR